MANRESSLWITGLEPYMDEVFVRKALALMGEEHALSVKIVLNKFTNEPTTYGLIAFDSAAAALMAMHKLNGKIMPNSTPPVRFQLSQAGSSHGHSADSGREYSIWISDLTDDVTDQDLRKTFVSRFETVTVSRLIIESNGKRFGFVRFSHQNDQREALIHMHGYRGLGEKAIKVSIAIPKQGVPEEWSGNGQPASSYSQYYEQYWTDNAWGNFGTQSGKDTSGVRPVLLGAAAAAAQDFDFNDDEQEGDEEKLIDHELPLNVDSMNADFIARSQETWDQIEKDRWIYNLDNDEGFVPNFKKKA